MTSRATASGGSMSARARAGDGVSGVLIAAPLRVGGAAGAFGPAAGERCRGRAWARSVRRRPAARCSSEPGDALLVLGFCGGLEEESLPGEVVIAESVLGAADEGHGPEPVACAGVEALGGGAGAHRPARAQRSGSCASRGSRSASAARSCARAARSRSTWSRCGSRPARASGRSAVVRVVLDSPTHELLRPQATVGVAARRARAAPRGGRASRLGPGGLR